MNLQHSTTIDIERPDVRNGSEVHLHGVRLVMARVAWVVIALFATGLLVASLPSYFAYLHMTNTTSIYGPQLAPGDVRELHVLGLSLDFYAWLNIGVFLVFWLICVSLGVVLFLRRPDDRLALLASLTLVFIPIGFNTQIMGTLPPAWTLPAEVVTFFGNICLGLFIFLFPSGRFVPRWSRWIMVVWIAYWVNIQFFPNSPLNNSWLFAIPLAGLVASQIALQVYRYRRVSTPLQRQQTKWVVFGIAVTFGGIVASLPLVDGLLPQFFPMGPLSFFFAQIPFTFLLLLFPLSIAFAILRNHLWEIDRLISRTLVYGTLTIMLGLIYAGLIIGLQALLGTIIKQNNDVAIVVSTLAIYVLFQPLRRRIQSIIDRRFYRRKYDAARTLAAFSATLRNEVDMQQLSEQLVAMVQETMQPEHVSLWLRPPAHQQVSWRATPSVPSEDEARGEK
jgi:hypothetical protein